MHQSTYDYIRAREYNKKQRSAKYRKLAEEFDAKYKNAAENYMRNKVDSLKETKPGQAYKILKNMGAQPGDCTDDNSTFS